MSESTPVTAVRRTLAGCSAAVGVAMFGSGVLAWAFLQPTTANIHSGYAWLVLGDWLLFTVVGGTAGLVAGLVLGLFFPRGVVPFIVAGLLFLAGMLGHGLAWARPSIDCDEQASVCERSPFERRG